MTSRFPLVPAPVLGDLFCQTGWCGDARTPTSAGSLITTTLTCIGGFIEWFKINSNGTATFLKSGKYYVVGPQDSGATIAARVTCPGPTPSDPVTRTWNQLYSVDRVSYPRAYPYPYPIRIGYYSQVIIFGIVPAGMIYPEGTVVCNVSNTISWYNPAYMFSPQFVGGNYRDDWNGGPNYPDPGTIFQLFYEQNWKVALAGSIGAFFDNQGTITPIWNEGGFTVESFIAQYPSGPPGYLAGGTIPYP